MTANKKELIIIVDQDSEGLFGLYSEGIREEYVIKAVYGIGMVGKTSLGGYELYPLEAIADGVCFDTVLIMSDQSEQISRLIKKLYPQFEDNMIYDNYSAAKELLDGRTKMELLKKIITAENNNKNPSLIIGEFSYYSSLDIYNELANVRDNLKCIIGKFSSIGPENVFLLSQEHHLDWITTYPLIEQLGKIGDVSEKSAFSKGNIIIGNDVWTGHGVTVLSGVTIGDGCAIGARTVVTKSVEPYSVVVGNPGRVIKKRFSEDKIKLLLEMKWWDWDYEDIYRVRGLLQSEKIEELYQYYKENIV
ncbi:CatB-related O-acetyltransferase [Butyrivibrio sp. YAB3001]|uniref:CatB-related O-acetyltransferase n=1 Tax=Butyrivibrio sp. YAB3001 TaxID=1520812 RepID=UPI0008F66069|nr:CatB-related O-acetyltransferase [Butyrivibrio sp. YAB3001]SFB94875.1 Acetyltransferase (isoleucine patch superfamily) [Butyrivibrio sp. YAB3001]